MTGSANPPEPLKVINGLLRRSVPCNDDKGGRPHQVEGNMQFPTTAEARMDYKAPIEPKDVDAIVDYLISIRGAN
jgi:hypothetical protein